METEYLWKEHAEAEGQKDKIKYVFTWVDSDFDLFTHTIYADNEARAIIEFFELRHALGTTDIKNFEIDLELSRGE